MPGKHSTAAILLALAAVACSERAREVTPAELQAMQQGGEAPLVIDVRTPAEYALGHVPGAVNVPHDQVAQRIESLETPNGVALYCMKGPRARKAETALQGAGYTHLFHLGGGLDAWRREGLPVESDGPP